MRIKTFAKCFGILAVLGLLSACGGGGGGTASDTWDTMKWDQDKWG